MRYNNILNPMQRLAMGCVEVFHIVAVWLSEPFLPLYRQCRRFFAFGWSILSTLASRIYSAMLFLTLVMYTAVYREVVPFFVALDLIYFLTPFLHLLIPVLVEIMSNIILLMVQVPLVTLTCLGMLVGIGVLKYFVGESPAFQSFQSVALAPFRFLARILAGPFTAFCSLIESLYNTVIRGRNPGPDSQSSLRHLITRLGFDLFYVLVVKYVMPIPRLPLPGEPCDISDLLHFMWKNLLKLLTKGPIIQSMLFLRLLRINVVHRDWLKRMMYSAAVRAYKAASEGPEALITEPEGVRTLRTYLAGISDRSLQRDSDEFFDRWDEYVVKKANEKLAKAREDGDEDSIPGGLRGNEVTFERCGFTCNALPLTGYALKRTANGVRHLNCDYVQLDLWVREHGRDIEGSAAGPEDFSPNIQSNNYISVVMKDVWLEFLKEPKNATIYSQIVEDTSREQSQSWILLKAHSLFHKGVDAGKLALDTIVYG